MGIIEDYDRLIANYCFHQSLFHPVEGIYSCFIQGTHCTGKTGNMAKKNPCQGKRKIFGNFAQAVNKGYSGCKFPDSKGIKYFDICHENS